MILFPTIRLAARALRRNRMRSLLTTLGVIIGVAALIVTVAAGEGAKAQISQQIASLGSNVILLIPGSTNQAGVHAGWGSGKKFTREDVAEIQRSASAGRYVAPMHLSAR